MPIFAATISLIIFADVIFRHVYFDTLSLRQQRLIFSPPYAAGCAAAFATPGSAFHIFAFLHFIFQRFAISIIFFIDLAIISRFRRYGFSLRQRLSLAAAAMLQLTIFSSPTPLHQPPP
jgi:hypothetical protein